MRNKSSICVLLFLISLLSLAAEAQTGILSGRVVTPAGQPIASAQINLLSSLDSTSPYATVNSDSNGSFSLTFDWTRINEANNRGATWRVVAMKTNYVTVTRNVHLGGNSIHPSSLPITLKALTEEPYFDAVDRCAAGARNGEINLYIFRLNAALAPSELTKFLDDLSFYLERGITAELQTNQLIDVSTVFKVRFCNGVPVEQREQAISFGQRLRSLGVIWGFLESAESRYNCSIRFTDLVSNPVEIRTKIHYDQDFEDKVLRVNRKPDNSYLAFASLTLGKWYLKQNKGLDSRRCLNYGLQFQDLPADLAQELNRMISQVNQNNPANNLTPVSGRNP